MRLLFLLYGCWLPVCLLAQPKDSSRHSPAGDSVLQEIIVNAFLSHQHWKAVPAAVAIVTSKEINRYSNTSLVAVLNTIPGLRMEERSPASYRLSVRGSLLRSPFGVRNVKVYWNEIPLTDAGGNTYLNLVDINQLTGAEIIKGPAASMYGAGTGGALLLKSSQELSPASQNYFVAGLTGGSYGLFQQQSGWQYSSKNFASAIQQTHQQSDGYREQSAVRKEVLKWQGLWQEKKQQNKFLIFYTELFYQTQGGITLAQMQLNPKLSRQAAGSFPGSVQQKAAVYNKTFLGGIHHTVELNDHFSIKSFFTGNRTAYANSFITNYEKREETNYGAGTNLIYQAKTTNSLFQWMNGVEWLYNHSLISNFGNRSGIADTVQFSDNIYARQWFAFSQVQYAIHEKWNFTAGLSLNNQTFRFKRLTDPVPFFADKKISLVVTPRLAVLYRLTKNVSLYALAAKGFSPPSLAEIRPSDGKYYGDLAAEYGWNYEAGIKGDLLNGHLQFDMAAYFFAVKNAIVRRNNAAGAEYFVNAGGTKQQGMEALFKYQLIQNNRDFISGWHIWSSYSYQPYRFEEYRQTTNNYSGNELTGVPRTIWVSGMDLQTGKGIYMHVSLNATASLPLTDANDAYANAYQLVQLKLGFRREQHRKKFDLFAGIDNLLNRHYSLGNDINAAGKRYYNPAMGVNFFTGIQCWF
ncbi:MAG: TonB-dependent receptor [Sediminibacterium sp.]|nr:TonB-dependent receptor [Sediminibacterium sp.]